MPTARRGHTEHTKLEFKKTCDHRILLLTCARISLYVGGPNPQAPNRAVYRAFEARISEHARSPSSLVQPGGGRAKREGAAHPERSQ